MSTRWIKIARDMRSAHGRLSMIVIALALSIVAVVTMLSAYSVLSREAPRNYLSTNPAAVQLELNGPMDAALLAQVACQPNIAAAELAAVTMARVEVAPGTWLAMRIFVVSDFENFRINTVSKDGGAWPPVPGTLLIERSALALSRGAIGRALSVEFEHSGKHQVKLGGVVHDPGLAPAWQEQVVYAYATAQTLAMFGAQVPLTVLKIVVAKGAADAGAIERTARGLSQWLETHGLQVNEARIPPPMQHPHQSQMNAVLMMLLVFSLLMLLLGGVLTAAIIGALLGQQARQIAIMKSFGAGPAQLAGLYLGLVAVLAALALIIAVPLGILSARALILRVAELLNLRIDSMMLPWTLYAGTILLGLVIPLAAAFPRIMVAIRTTVQAAIQDQHVSRGAQGATWWCRLPWIRGLRKPPLTLALRNLFRRRRRFMLTLLLLSGAGSMFLTSMNLRAAWAHHVAQAAADRQFDIELRLQANAPADHVIGLINATPGVRSAEAWSIAPAALAGDGGLAISHRYPDGGHGSVSLRAAPVDTTLIPHAMLAGSWLQPDNTGTAVINSQALSTVFPGAKVDTIITLKIGPHARTFRVVGIVRDILAPGTVYVTASDFALATSSYGDVNAVRIALTPNGHRPAVLASITASLSKAAVGIKTILTKESFAATQGAHIYILVWALGVIAAIMAIVGLLGLASSLGTSVIERTREFGIMRALGASSGVVVRSVMYEGMLIGLASFLVALPAATMPSALVGTVLASVSSQNLALHLSPTAAVLWLAGVMLAAAVVSYFPATRASGFTVKETLDWDHAG